MAEISTLFPQLEHLIVGIKLGSSMVVAILYREEVGQVIDLFHGPAALTVSPMSPVSQNVDDARQVDVPALQSRMCRIRILGDLSRPKRDGGVVFFGLQEKKGATIDSGRTEPGPTRRREHHDWANLQ